MAIKKKSDDLRLNKKIFVIAFFITLILFIGILFVGKIINDSREQYLDTTAIKLSADLNKIQNFMLLSNSFDDRMTCLVAKEQLKDLDASIWHLGQKIDEYRIATEEFTKDPYYKEQKVLFNENEVYYLMLLNQLKEQCNISHTIISFFYRKSEICKSCDDQSFVLADINREYNKNNLSIFYFDSDLELSSVNLLEEYYDLTTLPCVVINNEIKCGMQDKNMIIKRICDTEPNSSFCN